MKNIFCFFIIVLFLFSTSYSQSKNKAKNKINIIGLYSDVSMSESGDMYGTGDIKIEKKNGNYSGYFTQSYGTEGREYPIVALTDLVINEKDRTITFKVNWSEGDDLINPKYKVVTAKGKFDKKGINLKLYGVYEDEPEYTVSLEKRI